MSGYEKPPPVSENDQGFPMRADLLIPDGRQCHQFEVKPSTSVKDCRFYDAGYRPIQYGDRVYRQT